MAIHGDLKTLPLADLLAWLKTAGRSGILTVHRDGGEWELEVREGRVTGYGGPELRDYLGHIVVTSGLLTEDDLRRAIQRQRETQWSLQRILLNEGFLTQQELQQCLAELATESIYDLFLDLPGEFVFSDMAEQGLAFELEEAEDRLPLDLDINHLLMEGARRQDEWIHIRERFPRDDVRVRIVDDKLPPMEKLGVRERRILAGLAAGQSVSDLCLELRAPVPSVLRTLAELESEGAVQILVSDGEDGPRDASRFENLLAQATVLRQQAQYDEAVSLLEVAVRMRPDDAGGRAALKEALEDQIKDLYDTLPPLKVPTVIVGEERLRRLKLRPEERFLIDRLSACMDVGSLIMVSSLNERETLKTLKKLMHGGIIELR